MPSVQVCRQKWKPARMYPLIGKAAIIPEHLETKKKACVHSSGREIGENLSVSSSLCPINTFLQFLFRLTLIQCNVPPAGMERSCGKRYRAGCGCGPATSRKYEAEGGKYLTEG